MRDLDCDELVELVTEFLDGALDEETEQRVVDHLSLCDGCTTYVAQFRRTIAELGHLPAGHVAELPEPARSALLTAFRRQRGKSV
ncbi:MAG TPA: zf-HC2 domain-containing protein [Actinophytocola sp.]|jgi:anti-sigma factor RsiW|uniref:anti-sigma factor family protein n=1 Tax=Actinophytocola sp. TaxID=1872138 RepID=UPI002F91FF01